jgi:hypothetical protein
MVLYTLGLRDYRTADSASTTDSFYKTNAFPDQRHEASRRRQQHGTSVAGAALPHAEYSATLKLKDDDRSSPRL